MATDVTAAKQAPPVMDGLPPERRKWAVAAIFAAIAMASLDSAIANIALPAIANDLHVRAADVVWVVNVYQIALVATLLPLGALGEIVGHERIYLGGLLLFTLASIGCACAWSLDEPAGCPGAAGTGRQRGHEREFGTDPFHFPHPHPGPRLWSKRDGRCDGHDARANDCLGYSVDRVMAVVVRGKHSLRPDRHLYRPEDFTASATRCACLRFSGCRSGGG